MSGGSVVGEVGHGWVRPNLRSIFINCGAGLQYWCHKSGLINELQLCRRWNPAAAEGWAGFTPGGRSQRNGTDANAGTELQRRSGDGELLGGLFSSSAALQHAGFSQAWEEQGR